jgi:DNA-binding PadR family transcriptional regulator
LSPVFRHGSLRLYLLRLLDEEPRHGYEVIRLLRDRFMGVYSPSPGTIYPRLARLEEEGLVTHDEVDGRKVYRITEAGREELRSRSDELDELEEELSASVSDIVREVREDVRETVRSLREELTWAARESRRASQDMAADLRDQAKQARDEAREQARQARDEAKEQAKQAKQAYQEAKEQTKQGGEEAKEQAWQAKEEARQAREEAQERFRQAKEQARQAREDSWAAHGDPWEQATDEAPAGETDATGPAEAGPGGTGAGEAGPGATGPGGRSRAETLGQDAARRVRQQARRLREEAQRIHRETAPPGSGGPGSGGPGSGGPGSGEPGDRIREEAGARFHGGEQDWTGWVPGPGWTDWPGRRGWEEWAKLRGRRGWTGALDFGTFRDLERAAVQFTSDLRKLAMQSSAVGENVISDLRTILEEALERIKTEIFGPETPTHHDAPDAPAPDGPDQPAGGSED